MTSTPVTLALIAATALLAGCTSAVSAAEEIGDVEPSIQVGVAEVRVESVPRFLALTGSLLPNEDSDVAADAAGKVLRTYAERGSLVQKGAPLAALDAESARLHAAAAAADLESLRTQRELARKNCERADRLFREHAITKVDHERASTDCRARELAIEAATSREKLARKAVSDSIIRAPFAGLVAERYVSVGEFVRPDSRIVTLLAIDPLRLELTVPEALVGAVREGMPVEFEVSAHPGERFSATVRYVGPAVRRSTRDLVIEAMVDNRDKKLRPGMFASARLKLGDQALPVVPRAAVREQGSIRRLFVVANHRLEERVVQVGQELEDRFAIERGVKAGDKVAIPSGPGGAELKDGLLVR